MRKIFHRDIAIDLGSGHIRIAERGSGVIVFEPSLVALSGVPGQELPFAFGSEAKQIQGKEPPGVRVVQPIRAGVIADFHVAGLLVHHYLSYVLGLRFSLVRPRIVIGTPTSITEVEKRALRHVIEHPARSVDMVPHSIATALYARSVDGAHYPTSVIVDIGAGCTDCALIHAEQVVCSTSSQRGGDSIDEAVVQFIRRKHFLAVGERSAERLKRALIQAPSLHSGEGSESSSVINGRDLARGIPRGLRVSAEDLTAAVRDEIDGLVGTIRELLEKTPAELAEAIVSRGILLSGGVSLTKGFSEYVQSILQVPVQVIDDPFSAAVLGLEL